MGGGRWSLLRTPGTLGAPADEEEHAERSRGSGSTRYGIVARDWWRRERPRGRLARDLPGAQAPGVSRRGAARLLRARAGRRAVRAARRGGALRAARAEGTETPIVVMAASDPANAYALPLDSMAADARDPLARPRGAGALLVTRGGGVLLSVESTWTARARGAFSSGERRGGSSARTRPLSGRSPVRLATSPRVHDRPH